MSCPCLEKSTGGARTWELRRKSLETETLKNISSGCKITKRPGLWSQTLEGDFQFINLNQLFSKGHKDRNQSHIQLLCILKLKLESSLCGVTTEVSVIEGVWGDVYIYIYLKKLLFMSNLWSLTAATHTETDKSQREPCTCTAACMCAGAGACCVTGLMSTSVPTKPTKPTTPRSV